MIHKPFITKPELDELHRRLDYAGVSVELRRLSPDVEVIDGIFPFGCFWPYRRKFTYNFDKFNM